METRKGFETALDDIKNQFAFLTNYSFRCSGETKLGHIVSVGYKGDKYNILLNYEFMEEVFNFMLVDNDNPDIRHLLWKLIETYDPDFDYFLSKPSQSEYKKELNYLSKKIEKILPKVLNNTLKSNKL